MTIKGRFNSGLFTIKRSTNNIFIIIRIEIPAFDKLSAFTRIFVKEINENHD